jgi:hypothetical protein
MCVVIENRSDYALFVKMEVAKMPISNKFKKIVRQVCMDGYDDGFAMSRDGSLEHDKFKDFKCRT